MKSLVWLLLVGCAMAQTGWNTEPYCKSHPDEEACRPTPSVPPAPEPFDVEPIQVPSKEPPNGPRCMMTPCAKATQWCLGGGWVGDMQIPEVCSDTPPMVLDCANHKRIMLTDGNGKHHCFAFWQLGGSQ